MCALTTISICIIVVAVISRGWYNTNKGEHIALYKTNIYKNSKYIVNIIITVFLTHYTPLPKVLLFFKMSSLIIQCKLSLNYLQIHKKNPIWEYCGGCVFVWGGVGTHTHTQLQYLD